MIPNITPKPGKAKGKAVRVPKISKSENAIKQKTLMTKGINRTKTKIKK